MTYGKGGVGKTTMTANLGTLLALEGQRIAVVDADIGLRNLDIVMGLEGRVVLPEIAQNGDARLSFPILDTPSPHRLLA